MSDSKVDITILKNNVKDLQGQLAEANKRVLELSSRNSKLMTERESNLKLIKDASNTIKDIKTAINDEDQELIDKIQKQIDDWPDVLDSKPNTGIVEQPKKDDWKNNEWMKYDDDKH